MKKEYHMFGTLFFLISLAFIFEKITVTMIIASFIYCLVPDLDQLPELKKVIGHRNFLLHSIILWFIVYIFNPYPIFILIMSVVGLHCLQDVHFSKKKMRGYYTIKITKDFGNFKGIRSTIWLLSNFTISFIILMIWCFM